MPVKYHINEENNFLYVKVVDSLDREDMISFEAKIIGDTRVRPGFTALFDAAAIRVDDIDQNVANVLLDMERIYPERFKDAKRALLVSHNMGWDFITDFAKEADGNNLVFFSLDVALVWLGMKVEELPKL